MTKTKFNKPKKRALPELPPPSVRLLGKREVLAIVGITYPTLWTWMRTGKFPRSRIVGGKSMWLSTDIDRWMVELKVRPLKGDPAPVEMATSAIGGGAQ